MEYLWEMAYGESSDHMQGWRHRQVTVVTPICLELILSKMAAGNGYNGAPIGNGIWWIQWSRAWRRFDPVKGQGPDPSGFVAYYLKNFPLWCTNRKWHLEYQMAMCWMTSGDPMPAAPRRARPQVAWRRLHSMSTFCSYYCYCYCASWSKLLRHEIQLCWCYVAHKCSYCTLCTAYYLLLNTCILHWLYFRCALFPLL